MAEGAQSARVVRFGQYEAHLDAGELLRNGSRVKLQERPFQILAILLERPGEIVTREELRNRLWPADIYVDFDHSLNASVTKLRQALDDDADNPRFVATAGRRGYRFIAPVAALDQQGREDVASAEQSWRIPIARALALTVLALAIGSVAWRYAQQRAQVPPERIMLAVLPFENLTGDPEQDYFADGLTEELITQLGRLRPDRLGVIARTSVMGYKHRDKRMDEIGRELSVQYVLEGGVRQTTDRLRITAQLISVADQTHLWAEAYDLKPHDVLTVQDDVAIAVARRSRSSWILDRDLTCLAGAP